MLHCTRSRPRADWRRKHIPRKRTLSPLSDAVISAFEARPGRVLDCALAEIVDGLERRVPEGIARSTSIRKGASMLHHSPRDLLQMRQQTQASHDCHAPVDEVPQLTCVHASQLPPEALSLLSQPAPFVLHNHELWPAAERWGARDF